MSTAARGALVLFTRDLRVHDQQALLAATRGCDLVVPLFVLDRELLGGSCGAPNRLAFLLESLHDLDRALRDRGARLIVRSGDVVEQAMSLVHECQLTAIHMSADFTPYATRRHERLLLACERERVALHAHPGVTVLAPGAIAPAGGEHYRVFTPYWRVWSTREAGPVTRAPRKIEIAAKARGEAIPKLASLARESASPNLQSGGESAARKQLKRWLTDGAGHYDDSATSSPRRPRA